jgi:4-amino-4-deoxy-L-arabinose transferase-like glycosyltransferase
MSKSESNPMSGGRNAEDAPFADLAPDCSCGLRNLFAPILCFILSLAMHLPWLAITPIAGTEGHRIFPAQAMIKTHDWLAPRLFGEPFFTKPPLHHWLIAGSEIISGGGPSFDTAGHKALFFWRLPSALTGAALCAALAWFGARWFGKVAGLISGMCCLGMIAIWGQSQVADIDATNTLLAGLAALCYVEMLIVQRRTTFLWLAACTLSLAGMFMTKGPAGLPIVALTRDGRAWPCRACGFRGYWLRQLWAIGFI